MLRFGGLNVEKLVCDQCGHTITESERVEFAKEQDSEWAEVCRRGGCEPRGICPCPNVQCDGELVLKD